MPIYKVGDMHIKHGEKDGKEAKVYAPGDEIELTKAEAAKLGRNVRLAKEGEPAKEKDEVKGAEGPGEDEKAPDAEGGSLAREEPAKTKKGFFHRE
jgi:hypothetical protein